MYCFRLNQLTIFRQRACLHTRLCEWVSGWVSEFVLQKLSLSKWPSLLLLDSLFKRSRSTHFWQWFWYPNYPTTCFDLGWAMPYSEKQIQKQKNEEGKNIQKGITNKNCVKTPLKISQFHGFTPSQGYTPSQQKYWNARCLLRPCRACWYHFRQL